MRPSFLLIPNGFSRENHEVGNAETSFAAGRNEAVDFMVDEPVGRNGGLFRVSKD